MDLVHRSGFGGCEHVIDALGRLVHALSYILHVQGVSNDHVGYHLALYVFLVAGHDVLGIDDAHAVISGSMQFYEYFHL